MTEERAEPFEAPADPNHGDVIDCPECGEEFSGPMRKVFRGRHMRQKHGIEGSGSHSAGKKAEPKARTRSAPAARRPKFDYHGTVLSWYTLMGQIVSARDPVCGAALLATAEPAAQQWAAMAEHSEGVRKFLESGSSATGWFGLMMAHAPLVMSIGAHHVQPALARRRGELPEEEQQPEPEPYEQYAGNGAAAPDFVGA